jgi:hypothetical protein
MDIETLFSAVSPQSTFGGDPQSPGALETLGLACAGMPADPWNALLWRHLRDSGAWRYLYSRLDVRLQEHRSPCVRDRSNLIARLALAEEQHQIHDCDSIGHILLQASRRDWREKLRPAFLVTRAQLDRWCRHGAGLVKARFRG